MGNGGCSILLNMRLIILIISILQGGMLSAMIVLEKESDTSLINIASGQVLHTFKESGVKSSYRNGQGRVRPIFRVGLSFSRNIFLGDLYRKGFSSDRYGVGDLRLNRLGARMNLTGCPDYAVGLSLGEKYYIFAGGAIQHVRVFVSDEGSPKQDERNINSNISIWSTHVDVSVGRKCLKRCYLEVGVGYGYGRASPRIGGSAEMLLEFRNLGHIRDVQVTYDYLPCSFAWGYFVYFEDDNKEEPATLLLGVRATAIWRASDGLDGYIYVSDEDALKRWGGGYDSFLQLGVFASFRIASDSEFIRNLQQLQFGKKNGKDKSNSRPKRKRCFHFE